MENDHVIEWAKVTYGFKTKRISNPPESLADFISSIKAHFPALGPFALKSEHECPKLELVWHSGSTLQQSTLDSSV
jgi:hypothetical protein